VAQVRDLRQCTLVWSRKRDPVTPMKAGGVSATEPITAAFVQPQSHMNKNSDLRVAQNVRDRRGAAEVSNASHFLVQRSVVFGDL
jgi:hypothetical protein